MRAHHAIDRQALRDVHDAFQTRCEANTALYRACDLAKTTPHGLSYAAALVRARRVGIAPASERALNASCTVNNNTQAVRTFHASVDDETRKAALRKLNDRQPPSPRTVAAEAPVSEPVTYFHSRTVPDLTLYQLGAALDEAFLCGDEALLVALVLVDRYCGRASVKPTTHMMHRLYVTCLQVGIKAHCDSFLKNATFADLAGVALSELNCCESALLRGLDWRALVTSEECVAFVREMLDWRQANSPSKCRVSPLLPQAAWTDWASPVARHSAALPREEADVASPLTPVEPVTRPGVPCQRDTLYSEDITPSSNGSSFAVDLSPFPFITAPATAAGSPVASPAALAGAVGMSVPAYRSILSTHQGSWFTTSTASCHANPSAGRVDPETPPNTPNWDFRSACHAPASLPTRGLPHLRALFRGIQ
jgi:hypothetical protein